MKSCMLMGGLIGAVACAIVFRDGYAAIMGAVIGMALASVALE